VESSRDASSSDHFDEGGDERVTDPTPPEKATTPAGIRPVETALAIAGFILLCGNVWADWSSSDYSGGILSVALVGFILAILGKNAGNLLGGGK
jgi:hypothetical protein